MHDSMLYDPIQGQGQGHGCLKATQEESTVSPHGTNFIAYFLSNISAKNYHVN